MNRTALLLSLLLVCGASGAATWNYIYSAGDETAVVYLDSDSVQRHNGLTTVWFLTYSGPANAAGKRKSSRARYAMRCGSRTSQVIYAAAYDEGGKLQTSGILKGGEREVIPDTQGELLYTIACKAGFPTAPSDDFMAVPRNADLDEMSNKMIAFKADLLAKDKPGRKSP